MDGPKSLERLSSQNTDIIVSNPLRSRKFTKFCYNPFKKTRHISNNIHFSTQQHCTNDIKCTKCTKANCLAPPFQCKQNLKILKTKQINEGFRIRRDIIASHTTTNAFRTFFCYDNMYLIRFLSIKRALVWGLVHINIVQKYICFSYLFECALMPLYNVEREYIYICSNSVSLFAF